METQQPCSAPRNVPVLQESVLEQTTHQTKTSTGGPMSGVASWKSMGWVWRSKGVLHAMCDHCEEAVPITVAQCSEDGEEAVCQFCNEVVLSD